MVNGPSFRSGFNHKKRKGPPRRGGEEHKFKIDVTLKATKRSVLEIEDVLHYVRTVCNGFSNVSFHSTANKIYN